MAGSTYTSIPDTTDRNYWQIKYQNSQQRLTVFEPVNKELHRALLQRAWSGIKYRQDRLRMEKEARKKRWNFTRPIRQTTGQVM